MELIKRRQAVKGIHKVVDADPFDIQPDSLIFTDLHLHERKEFAKIDEATGLNSRLAEGLYILKQMVTLLNLHPEIKNIFSLGDPFELKDKVPNHILIEFRYMIEEISRSGRKHWALMGNHDFNIPKYPTAKLFDLNFISETTTIWLYEDSHFSKSIPNTPNVQIAFIPFQRDFTRFLELWKEVHKGQTLPNIVFFHQEVPGATYETGRKVPGIFPQSLFNPNVLYISGHIHKCQTIGQIQYVGSPYQIRFSDEGQPRYIWLLNSKTRIIAPIKLHYPEFRSISIEELQMQETTSLEDIVLGNYIRLAGEVEYGSFGPDKKREIKEKLGKMGAKGVTLDITTVKQHQSRIPKEIIEDDDTIIKMYVKDSTEEGEYRELDKEELARIGIELFNAN